MCIDGIYKSQLIVGNSNNNNLTKELSAKSRVKLPSTYSSKIFQYESGEENTLWNIRFQSDEER